MSTVDDETLRKEILAGFEYSYQHDDWVTPLEEALERVTAEQALRKPHNSEKGIWDIVLHLAVWNEDIVERVRTGERCHPAEGAWPPSPSSPDGAAWEAAKKRLWDSLAAVTKMIETSPIETIQSSPYGLGDLFCRLTHNGYHIGQITKLREYEGTESG